MKEGGRALTFLEWFFVNLSNRIQNRINKKENHENFTVKDMFVTTENERYRVTIKVEKWF